MVAIAAVDEAGNVDPTPAHWTWSVDARPRTSLDSAPQVRLGLYGIAYLVHVYVFYCYEMDAGTCAMSCEGGR